MSIPRKGRIRFYECEHQGDVDDYVGALGRLGAKVLQWKLDEDAEEVEVTVEIQESVGEFIKRFKSEESDAYEMSNLAK